MLAKNFQNFRGDYFLKKHISHLLISITILLSLFQFPGMAFADNSSGFVQVTVSEWFSFADSSWQISGPLSGGSFISKLEFDNIDSNITMVTGKIKFSAGFAVDFTYGSGSIGQGTVTDSDWKTDPSTGQTDFLFSKSKSEINDETPLFLSFNLYFDAFKLIKVQQISDFHLDFLIGYMHYEDNLRFINGTQTIINEVKVSIPFQGLNSTYDFSWDAARLGIRAEYQLAGDLFINGRVVYLPFISYDGEAFWNLRTDFLSTKPNFTHEAKGYLGYDLNFTLGYQPVSWFIMSAGYNFLYMNVKNGTDITFFADGTSGETDLDEVKVTRHGPFISISLRY